LTERLVGTEFRVKGLVDRQKERATIESNPLIAAGGAGILVVSFLAILVLVGAALLVSLWMAVQRRRTEFAVMRAMGVSRGQILRLLAFEYMLVAAVGLLVGAYLGLMVGRQMLSFLDVTETGERVEPGFILQTDWGFVAGGAAAVLGIFVLALFLAVRVLARTSDAQALRTE
jgi:putative ABC transport system permease protein